jgi:polyhydroxyalkanoate synthase subunit PhaC
MSMTEEEAPQQPAKPDFEAMSRNAALLMDQVAKATQAYLKPLQDGQTSSSVSNDVSDAVKTIGHVAEKWLSDPAKAMEAQAALTSGFLDLWGQTLRRFNGEPAKTVAETDPRDKRFNDPEWNANPVFDFLKQAYLLTSRWADDMVERAENLDEPTRQKARFYVKQMSSALSPSNFLATNPELIRQTLEENGANLVRGMGMLAEDIEAGHGTLKIRQTDPSNFQLGVNMATTPGKVVFRNDLMELIQYAPSTETVLKRPLLIVPPWINKFYILDLNPEKSFIRWAVSQGLTVFCISWVNPDERQALKSFSDYMHEGILAALDAIKAATGEENATAIGYCVGGTLLSVTLAYMAAMKDKRIESATFFTTQVDFTNAGDLKIFADETQIAAIEEKMKAVGYLAGGSMANAFNMLRPNDLIWPYIVNNYMKGHTPFPFDLLVWNSDSTRMPAANHSFYLRHCYLQNDLTGGRMEIDGVKLKLNKVKIPIYNLAAREDHIAPARSVYTGSGFFGGPVDFVLAGSGHIAGVVNPPNKPKYQYWTGGPAKGEIEDWFGSAVEHAGSWWPHWLAWIETQSPKRMPARAPGDGALKPLADAPGTYVTVRA